MLGKDRCVGDSFPYAFDPYCKDMPPQHISRSTTKDLDELSDWPCRRGVRTAKWKSVEERSRGAWANELENENAQR